jgi:hypothetical protein
VARSAGGPTRPCVSFVFIERGEPQVAVEVDAAVGHELDALGLEARALDGVAAEGVPAGQLAAAVDDAVGG